MEKFCSKCGAQFDVWDEQTDFEVTLPLGYGSKYDGDTLHMCLCNACLDSLIDSCAVTPLESTEGGVLSEDGTTFTIGIPVTLY